MPGIRRPDLWLALVAALAHGPRLLLLDEPTSGLDPVVRSEVLDVLWEITEDGEHFEPARGEFLVPVGVIPNLRMFHLPSGTSHLSSPSSFTNADISITSSTISAFSPTLSCVSNT